MESNVNMVNEKRQKHKKKHKKHKHRRHSGGDNSTEERDSYKRDSRHKKDTSDYERKYEENASSYHASNSRAQDCKEDLYTDSRDHPDYDFNFHDYRSSLNKIFFREDTFLKRGTKDYDDFWNFLKRYQDFQRKKMEAGKDASKHLEEYDEEKLALPCHYDKRYRVNIGIVSKNVEEFLRRGKLPDCEVEKELTIEKVRQFKHILLYYLDFLQKQKFNKLKKIRSDQENLPIFQYRQMILDKLEQNQIVVVAGDTGCGKSTQVPQYLLAAGYTGIACTQPRRIACISLSKRVGYETLNEYGSEVAFQVRFEKTKTRFTRILFLTEGLLLRQMTSDALLSQYNVIVIDEVHERHIHTDFLLGVMKCLLQHRKDLKLVLMSATININLFSNYFDGAPVVKVPGRLYPIQLEYVPSRKDEFRSKNDRLDPSPYLRIMQTIDTKYPLTERGDLLIFLSGMSEIMAVVEAAKAYAQQTKRWIVLPLHGTLSVDEQDKVFDFPPEGVRKCIVSTNIAETSVTIDGVRFIIDSGKVKEMTFDPKYKMQRLQEFWISQASAEQRKGRAGRTGPGVCYRLYEESDFHSFQEYATPEIQRVSLDSLILQMLSMGLPDVRKFPFLEEPEMSSIENALYFLKEQNAVTEDEKLTPIGQMLSRLPVEVITGKMLIMGSIFHMIDPVLSIAAALSVQSPFTSKAHSNYDAMNARKPLESDHGDPFTLLNAFDEWIQVKSKGQDTKKWCRRRGLEEQRFYEMIKLKEQFKTLLMDHNLLLKEDPRESFTTSDERRRKHGDRKRLGELKKEKNRESKRRKVLKLEDDDFVISDDEKEEDQGDDIKDLEFRLSHNLSKLQESSIKNRSFTLGEINLLKIILCSGLYPQVALADENNSGRSDAEQAFHTKTKPFLLLHPTCVFALRPELLRSTEMKEDETCPSDLRGKLSNNHQLLAYVSLLETNKPYLINTMRVPALQTVTMFSNSIDTDAACMRLVCDGWLEIRFVDEETASNTLSSLIQLRATWQNLLKLRLKDTLKSLDEDKRVNPRARQLEKILAKKLSEYLSCEVCYAIRRVMAAEQNRLYRGPDREAGGKNKILNDVLKSGTEGKVHPVKGGIQINHYLTYNCLLDESEASIWGEYTSSMQKHWVCPRCEANLIVSIQERLEHESECQNKNFEPTQQEEAQEMEEVKQAQMNPLRKHYFCDKCDQGFRFTTTEILKHKKSHVT
ncbi:probable ATP-dependent RNA helicase DHX34 [Magallana gigas]|uniref:probable ATP-dependent RNA helicase DHX34 n=1 Tax=Magallana gigas TaxID=29159 RepID=UPI0033417AE1